MKNPLIDRRVSLADGRLWGICLLLAVPAFALAATPRPVAGPAVVGAPAAAVPVNPLVEAVPSAWGNPQPAVRPQPAAKAPKAPSTALVPLPPPQTLARMPVGRVHIGQGHVDARSAMRHSAVYVVRAQAAGIVEYLYSQTGLTKMGQPLVRLYDLSILADLKIGESIMARFASSPFVIAPRQGGLPPLPPAAFPRPTVLQRLLGIRPAVQPTLTPAPSVENQGRAQLTPERRSSLARSTGLAPAPSLTPASAPAPRPRRTPDVSNITHTTADISTARSRVQELNAALTRLETELSQANDNLKDARDDASARERLYNQGVLARNLYEAAQRKVQELEGERQSLERKRSETTQAREMALQRLSDLQDQLDQQVANRRDAAADDDEPVAAPAPRAAAPQPASLAPAPRRASARRAAPRPEPVASAFPDPTQPSRPEIRRLPRLPGPSGMLVGGPEVPSMPSEVTRLAAPRWVDQAAPTEGLVVRQLVPAGAQVQPGQPLLEVANREFARVYTDVSGKDLGQFHRGAPVKVTFDDYPGVTLEGWINDLQPEGKQGLARVEMVVTAREGYYPDDTYASLEWLALAAPLAADDATTAVSPATEPQPIADAGPATIYEMLPLVPPQVGPGQDTVAQVKEGEFVGDVRMGEMGGDSATARSTPVNAGRLAKLRNWRDSFTAGMQTGIFGSLIITYPRDQEVARAIERMASGHVSHIPNMCAGTMHEALGWGLGDAAQWLTRLPERGYTPRKDGLARPGDILVWPFTYGPRRNQHIGVAVNQSGKLMLLSNLSGTLGTSELLGGYVAFYRPRVQAAETVKAKAPAAKTAKAAKVKPSAKPAATRKAAKSAAIAHHRHSAAR